MIHLFMRAAVKKALNNGAHCFPRFVRAFRSNSRSQMRSSPHDIIRFELRFCHRRAPSFEAFDQVVGRTLRHFFLSGVSPLLGRLGWNRLERLSRAVL